MDPKQFDAVVQALGTAGSRRSAVRRLTVLLAGAGFVPLSATAARSRRKRRHQCDPGLSCCRVGRTKQGKRKRACVNVQTNVKHCGACGHACAPDATCQGGQCMGGSGGVLCGPANCGGCCNEATCVSGFDQSNQNCGFGGVTCAACPEAFICQDGACVCLGPGDFCDPTVQPDQCCGPESVICSNGGGQPPGICCLQDGLPCQPTTTPPCAPDSGCCCSGVCGAGNICTPA